MSAGDDRDHGAGDFQQGDPGGIARGIGRHVAEQRHNGKDRNRGNVLEQEDREGGTAVFGRELIALRQGLQHESG